MNKVNIKDLISSINEGLGIAESSEPTIQQITESMQAQRRWIPVNVVHHIITQRCLSCDGSQTILSNTLIRHLNSQDGSTWDYPRDYDLLHLPEIIQEVMGTVPNCPKCLRKKVNRPFPPAPEIVVTMGDEDFQAKKQADAQSYAEELMREVEDDWPEHEEDIPQ